MVVSNSTTESGGGYPASSCLPGSAAEHRADILLLGLLGVAAHCLDLVAALYLHHDHYEQGMCQVLHEEPQWL